MIFVRRPPKEPLALAKQRRAGLKRALAALNAHGPGSTEMKDALIHYDGGKGELYTAQHRKCAYCGRRTGMKGNPVEHVRPKKEAWRHWPGKPPVVESGYWWLTWTWSNQLFACTGCNTGYKKSYFPLEHGSGVLSGPARPYPNKRLSPSHLDFSVESPLLIDPSVDDPLEHLEWRPVNRGQPKRLWKWSPAPLTPRGRATIEILQLTAQLADDVNDHVRDNALARTEVVCAHIDVARYTEAETEWLALGQDLVRSECELAGPTWNALHYLVDGGRRTKANLSALPRP